MNALSPWARRPMLVLGFAALGAGILAGLARLGWPVPLAGLASLHGPLMASGFFGTVISLERAVALGSLWAYGAPVAAAFGAVLLLFQSPAASLLFTFSSLLLLAATAVVYARQRALFTATLLAGAAAWAVGNGLWLAGQPFPAIVPWWAAFLALTIAGERLELSRLLPPSPAARTLFAILAAALLAATAAFSVKGVPLLLAGILLALALWLVRHDLARRTIRTQGLTRFVAVCLLSGYAWLAACGLLGLLSGGAFAAPAYDATLHTLFLGFVFAMVFGHAPIILPAVAGLRVDYHPVFYAHLALLHISLVIRVAGDMTGVFSWKAWGGLLGAVALALFLALTAFGILRAKGLRG